MPTPPPGFAQLGGQAVALGMACARDLGSCARRHPKLFPADPFDDRLFFATAMANAFGSPWETAERVRAAARTSLWVFAADYLVDYLATTRAEIDDLAEACRAVAAGGEPSEVPLALFLAELRDDLAAAPAFAGHADAWRDQLDRYFAAMAREWEWKQAGAGGRPTYEQYLANADNFGSSLVNIAHWIHTGDAYALAHLDDLRAVSDAVQRVLRLLNDLASYRRDLEWGDLNALLLGVTPDQVRDRIDALTREVAAMTVRLRPAHPRLADYLDLQVEYSVGFYGHGDYWGTPAEPE
jgi:hypothetical protein